MKNTVSSHDTDNVIDLFTKKPMSSLEDARFIRLSPELDGLEMLYSNESGSDKLFSLRILCWALRANGEVVGIVPWLIVQEVPDIIGTHAVMTNSETKTLTLQEVVSWRLHADGVIFAMIVDESKVENTPVLPGDPCLYASQAHDNFRYFFQHHIANKIKSEDPEALAAISLLVEEPDSGSA